MNPVLTISNLTKRYGSIYAIRNLSLQVEKGEVFGILGPNGSGKTTTLGIILGARVATSGDFEWFDQPFSKASLLHIGSLLEQPNFYPYLSAVNNLKIVADIKEVSHTRIDAGLSLVGLSERKNQAVKHYSFGMKQRLAIAAALLNDPQVLVLDEPTNGLDPQGIADVRDLIVRIAKQGTTIILASHLLDEVEKVCTHVAVLQTGQMIVTGTVDEVLTGDVTIELASDEEERLLNAIMELPYLKNSKRDGTGKFTATLSDPKIQGAEINRDFFSRGVSLSHLSIRKKSLETAFLEITNSTKSRADEIVKN